ncbi:hypothetical protein SAMN04487936_103317 [Halobacillus dabanensis]|uniref:Uncharacterized protein n=1 Tax=Halobacillus dabanensis TaxID=240302 RepID=A0A1I3TCZ6_HALDA|nr:hypothetical protein [Halobacillus dabanensis]SFJ68383.1 hypothetical protein SAMN04487936_103317 [Halobacillus dabanensis]
MQKKNSRKKGLPFGSILLPVLLLFLVYLSMKAQLGDGMMSSTSEKRKFRPFLHRFYNMKKKLKHMRSEKTLVNIQMS